jgi:SAM-dependent methyltransferase
VSLSEAMADPSHSCACCGAMRWRLFCERYGYEVWQCLGCKSAQVSPMPEGDAILALYDREYFEGRGKAVGYADYEGDRDAHLQNAAARLQAIDSMSKGAKGAVLDVGCGTGHFLEAVNSGRARYGIESSLHAAKLARRSGARIVSASAERLPFSAPEFELVTMWDVIEHLRDPAASLRQIRESIAPGGMFVVSTGDFGSLLARVMRRRWYLMAPPTHLHYFTRQGLIQLLEGAGFAVEAVRYESKRVSIRLMGYLAVNAMPMLGPIARPGLRSRYADVALRINLHDQMTIFARPSETARL